MIGELEMNPINPHQRGNETIARNSDGDERIVVVDATRRELINQTREICGLPWIAFLSIPADGCFRFYKRDRPDFGFLSNF